MYHTTFGDWFWGRTFRLFSSTSDRFDHATRAVKPRSIDTFPGVGEFLDDLAQEYGQASQHHSEMTLLMLATPGWAPAKRVEMAEFLSQALRLETTIFLVSDTSFAFILPGTKSKRAGWLATEIWTILHQHYSDSLFTMRWLQYPQDIRSLEEFESEVAKTSGYGDRLPDSHQHRPERMGTQTA